MNLTKEQHKDRYFLEISIVRNNQNINFFGNFFLPIMKILPLMSTLHLTWKKQENNLWIVT